MNNLMSKKTSVFLTVLFFFLIYGFSISSISMRYPILVMCFLWIILRFRSFRIPRYTFRLIIFFIITASYAMVLALVYSTGEYFETYRMLRCATTLLLISALTYAYKIKPQKMFEIIEFLLILHAIAIVIGIIWPEFKQIIYPISQYSKSFSAVRCSGLLNGDDGAAFFCNCGLSMETIKRIYNNKTPVSFVTLLFLVATVFTSRFGLLFAGVLLVGEFFVLLKNNKFNNALHILCILAPIIIVGGILWVLTTGVAMQFRSILIAHYPQLQIVYNKIATSFVDYGKYTNIIGRHTDISNISPLDMLFGVGYRLKVEQDVGYLKTMYSIGIVGIVGQFVFYFFTIKRTNILAKLGKIPMYVFVTYFVMLLLIFAWEIKNSFVFATGYFETLIALYFSMIYCYDEVDVYGEY